MREFIALAKNFGIVYNDPPKKIINYANRIKYELQKNRASTKCLYMAAFTREEIEPTSDLDIRILSENQVYSMV